jgi:hypothetical protein
MTFMPDLIATYCILHNILLGQRPDDVARLLWILQRGLRDIVMTSLKPMRISELLWILLMLVGGAWRKYAAA